MPYCTVCNRETVSRSICHQCERQRQKPLCRGCGSALEGGQAICLRCGGIGNPMGAMPTTDPIPFIRDVIDAARKGLRVLCVSVPEIPHPYIERVLRESFNATDEEMGAVTFAVPRALTDMYAARMVFTAIVVHPSQPEEVVAQASELLERPPPPSIWARLRTPEV